jgi:DNA-binding NarL/FixJ family response regulator
METKKLNLFIVDDNQLVVADLRYYLGNRFGADIEISTFDNGEDCLALVDKDTHIVILDYYMEGKNGVEVLKSIKAINPETNVIMLSGNEDMAVAIESFRAGAKDFVLKGIGARSKVTMLIYQILTAPLRIMTREFGISRYLSIFLLTFATVGIAVACVYGLTR